MNNKKLELLDELLRTARSLISPISYHDHLNSLSDRDFRNKLFDGNPKCYLTIKYKSKEIPFFPICNRTALEDPRIIKFSLKLAKKMVGKGDVDQEHLIVVIKKLESLHKKFIKETPKPTSMAVKKAASTRQLTKIKKELDKRKNK
jgi:hypothetical protein